ncbi:reverse transcriptase domain-containing protein [Artemisia annua]|uniref:Reverse transcriptase domain-containing protein n=1 Tax=Artemisia annua TaxID=35608 RepID=A0A2U1LUT8_ARTAN|nr:reverse transcriptase domain-containing protein [Artemisia annua]
MANGATSIKTMKEEKVEIPKPKARDYPMMTKEANYLPEVITCTILTNLFPDRVLYDSGESVSFLSYDFIKRLSTPLNRLPKLLEVKIADNKEVTVSHVLCGVDIEIDDNIFKIDLIPILLGEFDIVIGMDWLGKHNAAILRSQKIIQLKNSRGREFSIYGEKEKDVSSGVWSGVWFSVVGSEMFTPTSGSLGSGPKGPPSSVVTGTVVGASSAMASSLRV